MTDLGGNIGAISLVDKTAFEQVFDTNSILAEQKFNVPFVISNEESSELIRIYDKFNQHRKPGNCIDRAIILFDMIYDTATEPDFAIFLIVSALENIVLRDMGSEKYRGELKYRFSHRLAAFLGKTSGEKKKLLKLFAVAYDVRSIFAHGGDGKVTVTISDGDTPIEVFKMIMEIQFRTFFKKILLEQPNPLAIPWDDYLFQ